MTEPTFEPERIIAALNAAGVAYVIVGGIAVAAHGVIRATGDVDVVPEPSDRNLSRLAAVLNDLGAELRDDAITLEVAPGVRAVVCSLADLRSMKRASGRPKDLIDIAELEELHGAG